MVIVASSATLSPFGRAARSSESRANVTSATTILEGSRRPVWMSLSIDLG